MVEMIGNLYMGDESSLIYFLKILIKTMVRLQDIILDI